MAGNCRNTSGAEKGCWLVASKKTVVRILQSQKEEKWLFYPLGLGEDHRPTSHLGCSLVRVSDGDEELTGNWNKSYSCYTLAKRLAAFCPCPRDLWNFELERDDLGYLGE